MRIIEQSWKIEYFPTKALEIIEMAGRTCYKSKTKGGKDAERFVKLIVKSGHHSVIEHVNVTVRIITNRGVTHELVRHRIASYSQESTRYCDYYGEVTFIRPVWWENATCEQKKLWKKAMTDAENIYNELRNQGWKPEQARDVLPNALKAEIVVTMNLRSWLNFFNLRRSEKAHPQIRSLADDIFVEFCRKIPAVFA